MVFTPMVRGRGMTDEMRQARINQNLLKQEGTGWDVGNGKSSPNFLAVFKFDSTLQLSSNPVSL
jgi:hypothetical protein